MTAPPSLRYFITTISSNTRAFLLWVRARPVVFAEFNSGTYAQCRRDIRTLTTGQQRAFGRVDGWSPQKLAPTLLSELGRDDLLLSASRDVPSITDPLLLQGHVF